MKSENNLTVLHKEQAFHDEPEELLLGAVKGRRFKFGDTHPHTMESLNCLIDLYDAWNKPEEAKEWREKLAQIEDFEG